MVDSEQWWNNRDMKEREGVIEDTKEKYEHLTVTDRLEALEYRELNHPWQKAIEEYYNDVIIPQQEKQQTQYDGMVEETLPDTYKCPRCDATVEQVVDKRGVHWKCHNCGWDTNRPFDFDRESRRKQVLSCARRLKKLFPELNFVENYPYSPDLPLTGDLRQGKTKYDLSVYWMGNKLTRLRVERNQHLTKQEFYQSKFCYVIGVPKTVEYLAKRKALVVHYLIDEPKEKILMSRMDKVVEHCPMETDHFGNQQYFIPKDARPLIVIDDIDEMRDMLYSSLHNVIYKDIEIV